MNISSAAAEIVAMRHALAMDSAINAETVIVNVLKRHCGVTDGNVSIHWAGGKVTQSQCDVVEIHEGHEVGEVVSRVYLEKQV